MLSLLLYFFGGGAIAPIYFKQVAEVSALEVLSHRILWSFFILLPLIFFLKQTSVFARIMKNKKTLVLLFFSTIFVSLNWFIFILAISHDMIIEASLGYFINPLVNVLLGYIIFKETLSKTKYIAIFIAFLAVLFQTISLGEVPIISLALAFSFGLYGMLRKKIQLGSVIGLFVEIVLLLPFAEFYLYYLNDTNSLSFLHVGTHSIWPPDAFAFGHRTHQHLAS